MSSNAFDEISDGYYDPVISPAQRSNDIFEIDIKVGANLTCFNLYNFTCISSSFRYKWSKYHHI